MVVGLTACSTINESSQMDKLDKTINTYNALIRWGDYQGAAGYRIRKDNIPAPLDMKSLKDFRVTSYETKQVTVSPDKAKAYVIVEFEYYNEYQPRSKKYVDKQTWMYNEQAKIWRLDGDLPKFGQIPSR